MPLHHYCSLTTCSYISVFPTREHIYKTRFSYGTTSNLLGRIPASLPHLRTMGPSRKKSHTGDEPWAGHLNTTMSHTNHGYCSSRCFISQTIPGASQIPASTRRTRKQCGLKADVGHTISPLPVLSPSTLREQGSTLCR